MLGLSRLSRARSSVVVRPALGHANPHFLDRARFIDPAHPAAQLGLRQLPVFVCPQFTIRAFPNAILHQPTEFVPLNPLLATALVRARSEPTTTTSDGSQIERRHLALNTAKRLADTRLNASQATISLLFHTSKKATSGSSVIRRRLRSRMIAAIRLIVSRNADTVDIPEVDHPSKHTPYPPLRLVSRPLREDETLVLQGWTYLVIPSLSIYKIPLPNLIQVTRKALLSLNKQAKRMETSWSAIPNC